MKVLQSVRPTAEQLPIIRRNDPGVTLIRGAAGSGKTTTALLRIKFLAAAWKARHERLGIQRPVKMLVLTYNKTLRGYIKELTDQQVEADQDLTIEVKTFAKWAYDKVGDGNIVSSTARMDHLATLAARFRNSRFVSDEAEYAMSKFLPMKLDAYLECERVGRGRAPRCDKALRASILNDVVVPYTEWKNKQGFVDFNDLAARLAQTRYEDGLYDVIIIDEAQDFSANEVRAVMNHLESDHSITFVLDGAQRIYPKNFTWKEVGIQIIQNQNFKLSKNYRNTKEIAAFVAPLLKEVEIGEDDGALPDFNSCEKSGSKPIVLVGKYSQQLDWAINYIRRIDLSTESVVFLKPLGGRWFNGLRERLTWENLDFIELTRKSDWPEGDENIAICTMHSAKGLEFDHVIVLGLSDTVTPHGEEPGDVHLDGLRRLLAMALGRARSSIVVGYKETEASSLITYFDPTTFDSIKL